MKPYKQWEHIICVIRVELAKILAIVFVYFGKIGDFWEKRGHFGQN
jgi:hypothetical protein